MQTIGKISLEKLQGQLSDTNDTAKPQGKNNPILTDGLKTTNGEKATILSMSRKNGIADSKTVAKVIRQTRLQSLLTIKADDHTKTEGAILVREFLTPITYEESAQEVARWLMHYPRRHVEQDAVIIQDLAEEFESLKFGIGVVVSALREIRNEYKENNPWVPQTGYVLSVIIRKQDVYKNIFRQLTAENTPRIAAPTKISINSDPYEGKFWAQFDDYDREDFLKFLKLIDQNTRRIFLESYHAPQKLLESAVIDKILGVGTQEKTNL